MDIQYCYRRGDTLIAFSGGLGFHHEPGSEEYAEIESYLADHPEALVPEPTPPEPSLEELAQREIQSNLAYLASTDWYVVRFAETGVAIPAEVTTARSAARARIDELR